MMVRTRLVPVLAGCFAASFAGRAVVALSTEITDPVEIPNSQTDDDAAPLPDALAVKMAASETALAEARAREARALAKSSLMEEAASTDRRLAAVYAAMTPDKAAIALGGVPPERVAKILSVMPPRAAGAIISSLDDDAARVWTAALAD